MDVSHPLERFDADDAVRDVDFDAANAAVARLSAQYPQWALRDLAAAREVAMQMAANADPAPELESLREFAHNVKGQAGSFGFVLAGDLAALLYDYISALVAPTPLQLRTIIVHLDALRAVFARRMTGDGGELGRKLLARLKRTGASTAA